MTGRDGYVEYHFFSQVKGSDSPTYLVDEQHLSHDFEVPTILWLLDQPLPTMLAVCGTGKSDEPVYWTWLALAAEAATAARGNGWRDQTTVALQVPPANRLAREQRDRIADDVARAARERCATQVPVARVPLPIGARRRTHPADYQAWARFWGPIGIEPQLDEGYLLDPVRHARFANKDGQTLEQLAARPMTLRFLLEVAQTTSPVPSAPSDLYHEGRLRLCQDEQIRARAGLGAGRMTARERLAIAKTVAPMSVLTGRPLLLLQDLPLWTTIDEPMKGFRTAADNSRVLGYAGQPSAKATEACTKYVVGDMFAKGVQGTKPEDAVTWAASELKKIYG